MAPKEERRGEELYITLRLKSLSSHLPAGHDFHGLDHRGTGEDDENPWDETITHDTVGQKLRQLQDKDMGLCRAAQLDSDREKQAMEHLWIGIDSAIGREQRTTSSFSCHCQLCSTSLACDALGGSGGTRFQCTLHAGSRVTERFRNNDRVWEVIYRCSRRSKR
ncbi:hypothetical protein AWENTII_009341 [Aspergillus wentii]